MVRLPDISGEKLIKLLKKDGFEVVRQKGSHVSLRKITLQGEKRTVVPLHSSLAKGTLMDILKQCGLTKEDLYRLIEK